MNGNCKPLEREKKREEQAHKGPRTPRGLFRFSQKMATRCPCIVPPRGLFRFSTLRQERAPSRPPKTYKKAHNPLAHEGTLRPE